MFTNRKWKWPPLVHCLSLLCEFLYVSLKKTLCMAAYSDCKETWATHLDRETQSEWENMSEVIQRSGDKANWKESEFRPQCCYYRLIYSSGPLYSNSSPLKIRCSKLLWWLLWAECVLLQVLHEIARVRWRGLWCFWVNTSSELFGCWSWGAIRLLSVNPTS